MSKALAIAGDFTQQQLDLIKATVAKGATNDELALFLYRCKNLGLDPLKPGEVHFIKYGDYPGAIVTGLGGFRKNAMKTGKHVGTKRGVTKTEDGRLIGWAEVYRSDWQMPAREDVPMDEYFKPGKNGKKSNWELMPETMIKKVAECAALRMAFPDELGGLYEEDELSRVNSPKEVKEATLAAREALTAHPEAVPEFVTESIEVTASGVIAAQEAKGIHLNMAPGAINTCLSAGDFVLKVGKAQKGKRVKDLPRAKLEASLAWFEAETDAGKKFDQDVIEDFTAIHAYLRDERA